MLALTLVSCLSAVQAASVDSVQFMPPQILQAKRLDRRAIGPAICAGGDGWRRNTIGSLRQGATQAGPSSNPTDEIASTGVSPADPGMGDRTPKQTIQAACFFGRAS